MRVDQNRGFLTNSRGAANIFTTDVVPPAERPMRRIGRYFRDDPCVISWLDILPPGNDPDALASLCLGMPLRTLACYSEL